MGLFVAQFERHCVMASASETVCIRIPRDDAMRLYLFLVSVQSGKPDEASDALEARVDFLVCRIHQTLYEAQVRSLL
jgi:hypothetical protein